MTPGRAEVELHEEEISMRRILCVTALAAILMVSTGGAALANHDHNLITPGTTVVDIGNGQTEKCASDPGGHQYHEHVHLGVAGVTAFANPNNPVSVIKTESASC